MIFSRTRIAILLAGWCCLGLAVAQEGTTSGSSGSSGSGSSGSSGTTGSSGSSSASGSGPGTTGSTTGSTGSSTTSGSSSSGSTGSGGGASSFFDSLGPSDSNSTFEAPSSTSGTGQPSNGTDSGTQKEAAASFALPGFYGQGTTRYYGGSGRLGRPDFDLSLSFGFGYDDNIFQASSDGVPTILPAALLPDAPRDDAGNPIVEQPKIRRIIFPVQMFGDAGLKFFKYRARFETIEPEEKLAEIPPDEPKSSFFTTSSIKLEMQQYTRRSLLTVDASVGRTFYLDKDEDPVDYNGNFSTSFLYKITPRLQLTAQVNIAYLSQPDLSRANTPERQIRGDIINSLGRFDLTYRLTPRTSTTTSVSYFGNRYTEKVEQISNYDQWTLGLQANYLWKPRLTLIVEARHATTAYPNNKNLDSDTNFLLVGGEFVLNQRISGSLRFGGTLKTFKTSGDSQVAPYLESSLVYRSTARSSVTWTNRFGFEESNSPDEERLVYRSTINYAYAFTPRLSGSASINLLHEISTNKVADSEFTQDTFDAALGLGYQWTKDFNVYGNYTFTIVNSNTGTQDYIRNRISFGGQITF